MLSLTPLAVRQSSRLIFFHLSLHGVWQNLLLGKQSLSSKAKEQSAEGLTGEILSSPLQFQSCIRVTNIPVSTFDAAYLCSSCWPCRCELGEGRKLPAKKVPFSFKFLPDHGVKVIEEPARMCPNKHNS